MATERVRVLVAGDADQRDDYLASDDQERLAAFADWTFVPCKDGQPLAEAEWGERVGAAEAIVRFSGAPAIDAELMAGSDNLRIIGELNGDRFAAHIDVEAAWARGIHVVDTTNGSSYPVSEWALGMILVSLRNAGFYMRRFLAGHCRKTRDNPGYLNGELTGKRVGLIGCGHAGRRLVELLRPFKVDISVYDPYLARDVAEILDLSLTSLEKILAESDAIVCLAPLTSRTEGMIGRAELDLIPSGAVLVNVSRGPIIESAALVERLKRGDIIAGLDVFDPEPIPDGHEITTLENVFLTPHIAGVTAASYLRFFTLMVDELERFFHGYETYYNLTPRSLADRRGEEISSR
ncbi:MAG: hydroxyacid dehydrogenase [Candidatus Latescibacteria bacterium]|nr:hydroxyacid dehydrogenase [Candidatus Latescibacterota bacterium]